MNRVEVYFSLGSNAGEREINLMRAVNLMDQAFLTHPERISRIVETPADGFDGAPFLNMCLLYRLPVETPSAEHAEAILRQVKEIEKSLGRDLSLPLFDASGNRIYHDRPIDIDIISYGEMRLQTEDLELPHPRAGERSFVKIPLREISKPSLREAFPEFFD